MTYYTTELTAVRNWLLTNPGLYRPKGPNNHNFAFDIDSTNVFSTSKEAHYLTLEGIILKTSDCTFVTPVSERVYVTAKKMGVDLTYESGLVHVLNTILSPTTTKTMTKTNTDNFHTLRNWIIDHPGRYRPRDGASNYAFDKNGKNVSCTRSDAHYFSLEGILNDNGRPDYSLTIAAINNHAANLGHDLSTERGVLDTLGSLLGLPTPPNPIFTLREAIAAFLAPPPPDTRDVALRAALREALDSGVPTKDIVAELKRMS